MMVPAKTFRRIWCPSVLVLLSSLIKFSNPLLLRPTSVVYEDAVLTCNAIDRTVYNITSHYCCTCPAGQHLERHCNQFDPATTWCVPCPFDETNPNEQTYMDELNNAAKCKAALSSDACDDVMNAQRVPGSRTTNARCICKAGFHEHMESIRFGCFPHSSCSPGFYAEQLGTATSDTICRRCRPGTFSDVSSQTVTCKTFSSCPDGVILQNGTSAHDVVCNGTVPTLPKTTPMPTTESSTIPQPPNITPAAQSGPDNTGWIVAVGFLTVVAVMEFIIIVCLCCKNRKGQRPQNEDEQPLRGPQIEAPPPSPKQVEQAEQNGRHDPVPKQDAVKVQLNKEVVHFLKGTGNGVHQQKADDVVVNLGSGDTQERREPGLASRDKRDKPVEKAVGNTVAEPLAQDIRVEKPVGNTLAEPQVKNTGNAPASPTGDEEKPLLSGTSEDVGEGTSEDVLERIQEKPLVQLEDPRSGDSTTSPKSVEHDLESSEFQKYFRRVDVEKLIQRGWTASEVRERLPCDSTGHAMIDHVLKAEKLSHESLKTFLRFEKLLTDLHFDDIERENQSRAEQRYQWIKKVKEMKSRDLTAGFLLEKLKKFKDDIRLYEATFDQFLAYVGETSV